MGRRSFSREFQLEAVRLVRDRGVSIAQASRDLDVHGNVLRKWTKQFDDDPGQAFPGHGVTKPKAAKPAHKPIKADAPGYQHIDVKYLPQMADEDQRRYLFVAIDRATRWVLCASTARRQQRTLGASCAISIVQRR